VALGQTTPGPLAAQVAMWVGYLNRGAWGALVVAAAFIGPAFIIVVVVGALYTQFSGLPLVQSLFYGIAPAVMAIITIAGYKLLKLTDRRDWRLWGISAAVFAVTALTGSEPVPMILAAGIMMLLLDARPSLHRPTKRKPRRPPKNGGMTLRSWFPALLLPAVLGPAAAGAPCWPWACSSCRPAPWSSAPVWPSSRCCATASWPSTTGSPRDSSWTPSPWA
jgi:chromate transporter